MGLARRPILWLWGSALERKADRPEDLARSR
jgi:hypothetical protein